MKILLNGIERDVTVKAEGNGLWKCTVGKALIYWRAGYTTPYVLIKGQTLEVVNQHKPTIVKFLKEYKRLVSQPKAQPVMAYVGDETDLEYASKARHHDPEYVSGCPLWLTNLKEWKLCKGPKYTYMRRVRLPKEHKSLADTYTPHCCVCPMRADCDQPCTSPEFYKTQELLPGM